MNKEQFVTAYGGIFEHSAWVAERSWSETMSGTHSVDLVHGAMCQAFQTALEPERLAVLVAHPDLAGKLATAKRLTAESTSEQASAGLDALTDAERETFQRLNDDYTSKFGFPYIIAVKGLTKDQILQAFETRIGNNRADEFETACAQVERIALLRLTDMLPEE